MPSDRPAWHREMLSNLVIGPSVANIFVSILKSPQRLDNRKLLAPRVLLICGQKNLALTEKLIH